MGGARQDFEDEILTLVVGAKLVVAVWRDAPRVAHMEPMWQSQRALARRIGGNQFVFVNVVVSGTPSFDNEVRRELAEMTAEFNEGSLGQASLILLEGFAGTATRAFISTINLVSRSKAPNKVFKERAEVEEWVFERIRSHHPDARREAVAEAFDLAEVPQR